VSALRTAVSPRNSPRKFGTTACTDYRTIIEKIKPEFVAALGHVAAMPGEFRFLVHAGIPFVMEKPWGLDAKTVNELPDYGESKRLVGRVCG